MGKESDPAPSADKAYDVELHRMRIPTGMVADAVTLLQADPRYISHRVTDNGDGTSTIEVLLKVPK